MINNIKKTEKSVCGTSFYYGYVYASGNEIAKICGDPFEVWDDKTLYEWHLESNGIVFTIYDYRSIIRDMDDVIYYHIGTLNEEDTKKVIKILKENGLDAYYDN